MDDTRHIAKDQYKEIECTLDDLLHNADVYSVDNLNGKEKAKDECLNTILDILCLDKPDDITDKGLDITPLFPNFDIASKMSETHLKILRNMASHISREEMGFLIKEFMLKEHISMYAFAGNTEDDDEKNKNNYSGVAIISENIDDHVIIKTTINELEESLD